MTMKYKTDKENFEEALGEARLMTVKNIRIALQQRGALHNWAVKAYEQALAEKQAVLDSRAKDMNLPSTHSQSHHPGNPCNPSCTGYKGGAQ